MEELKELISMLAHLPQLTVWVLVGFLAYKLAVVGSIYGVIRLIIVKVHDWKVNPAPVQLRLGTRTINEDTADALRSQVARLGDSTYIHNTDVRKLKEALDIVLKEKP